MKPNSDQRPAAGISVISGRGPDGDPVILVAMLDADNQFLPGGYMLACSPDYIREIALRMIDVADAADCGTVDLERTQ